ncbi:ABC transporter permease [Ilumatobacter sp.]|uniref:ABC transporter permease n=1 Tax=Ilumatobacter sp. TaxID=1967498 RepID=UPI003B523741
MTIALGHRRARSVGLRPVRVGALARSTIGIVAYLVLWEVVGRRGWFGSTFPPLSDIVATLTGAQRRPVLARAFSSTASAAGIGLVLGVVAAVSGAALSLVAPPLRRGIDQLAIILHAVPVISLAPLFIVTIGREGTPIAIAALSAGFAMFVAATAAVEAARPPQHDVFTALGSGAVRRFVDLQLPASIPGMVDGLRLAAPAALLGAVLGEWFGAPRGLGVLIVSAMQNYQIELLWAAALATALTSMIVYGMLTRLARVASRRWPS